MKRLLSAFIAVTLSLPSVALAFGESPVDFKDVDQALTSKTPGITRDGATLTIATDGAPVEFKDSEDAKYFAVGFFQHSMKRMDYFIFQGGSEVQSYQLVNGETGAKLRVQGLPRISPDGKRYLMVSMDLEAGSVRNLVQIVSTKDFSTEYEKHYAQDDGIGPAGGTWVDNSRIIFLEHGMQRVPAKAMTVELKKGKWIGPREVK